MTFVAVVPLFMVSTVGLGTGDVTAVGVGVENVHAGDGQERDDSSQQPKALRARARNHGPQTNERSEPSPCLADTRHEPTPSAAEITGDAPPGCGLGRHVPRFREGIDARGRELVRRDKARNDEGQSLIICLQPSWR